jgi:hypothetical protein
VAVNMTLVALERANSEVSKTRSLFACPSVQARAGRAHIHNLRRTAAYEVTALADDIMPLTVQALHRDYRGLDSTTSAYNGNPLSTTQAWTRRAHHRKGVLLCSNGVGIVVKRMPVRGRQATR